jgi:hypothetical protein
MIRWNPNIEACFPKCTHFTQEHDAGGALRRAITRRLPVFRCQVHPRPDAPPRVGHNAQTALENGSHHGYVGTVPNGRSIDVCKCNMH